MNKWRLMIAILLGTIASASSGLALNFPFAFVYAVAMFLIAPGGIVVALITKSANTLVIVVANIAIYAAIVYLVIIKFYRNTSIERFRRFAVRLFSPALILICLFCIPSVNPLWPKGMTELAKQESSLKELLPLGINAEAARSVLQSQKVLYNESVATKQESVFRQGTESMIAQPGERTISARIKTSAYKFPCGYDLEIVLLFNRNQLLKQKYISRFPMCP